MMKWLKVKSITTVATAALLSCGWSLPSLIQAQEPSKPVSTDLGPRRLAEGILTVVPPSPQPEETSLGPLDLDFVAKHPELQWTPVFSAPSETLLEKSKGIVLRHPIYALEFAFKPMRMIEVSLPSANGEKEVKLVWYLIYRVRYLGKDLVPDLQEENVGVPLPGEPKEMQRSKVLFVPRFVLVGPQKGQEFPESILPAAKGVIAAKERVGHQLYDNFEMMRKIPLSTEAENNEFWGVATWTNVDPSIDFFSVQVEGLTNAYRVVDDAIGRKFEKKMLQIHFWRPGDSIQLKQDVIRLGAPAFEQPERVKYALDQLGIKERLDYTWIYR